MLGVDFQIGANLFALINVIQVVLFFFFVYIYLDKKSRYGLWGMVVVLLSAFFFSSVTAPKVSIDIPIEGFRVEEEFIIETPEPRTKVLKGFEQLNKGE